MYMFYGNIFMSKMQSRDNRVTFLSGFWNFVKSAVIIKFTANCMSVSFLSLANIAALWEPSLNIHTVFQ